MMVIVQSTAATVAPAAGAQTAPLPTGDPGRWIAVADYPAEALAKRQQGVVGFSLAIDARGEVSGCRVVSSSGAASLDDATCRLIRARAHFEPARGPDGRAVAGVFTSRVRWVFPKIKTAAPPATVALSDLSRHRYASSTLTVDADGVITACTRTAQPYENVLPPPDMCSAYPVGSRYGPPTSFHGKPIGRKVTISISIDETNIR